MGLDLDALGDDEMKALMLDEPRLLRRPVLKVRRKALIGFDADEWEATLG